MTPASPVCKRLNPDPQRHSPPRDIPAPQARTGGMHSVRLVSVGSPRRAVPAPLLDETPALPRRRSVTALPSTISTGPFEVARWKLRALSFNKKPGQELEHQARDILREATAGQALGNEQARDMGRLGLAVGYALAHGWATPTHHEAFVRALLAQAPTDLSARQASVFQFAALYGAELGSGWLLSPPPEDCQVPDAVAANVQQAAWDRGLPANGTTERSCNRVIESLHRFAATR